jgi:hypothetical protein
MKSSNQRRWSASNKLRALFSFKWN